ncbi:conserved hypothetical protein [Pediculus humanus corporis]|uniref:Uncharacterized protein n=1 Tax=Pediculus humanus subsp. corporis TaxID=121224 RepID=E0VQ43_PEDHC|nr:uncharacterized protein Phum_PHUM371250 [Pediculus humanus corporis]EEB15499.1 conserved hypothetical protein [Pediculus humanus corporis]
MKFIKKEGGVSWVRHRDIHLLTVGRYTYTSDQRFQTIHLPQTEDWTLQVRYPQRRDSECTSAKLNKLNGLDKRVRKH